MKRMQALSMIEFFSNHPDAPVFIEIAGHDVVDGEAFIQHLQVKNATGYHADFGQRIEIEFWDAPVAKYEVDQEVSVIVAEQITSGNDQALPGQ